jgi:hypothetical protein
MSKIYVYITKYSSSELCGRLYALNGTLEIEFNSLPDMIIKTEKIFNVISSPQSTFENRTFSGSPMGKDDKGMRYPDMEQINATNEHDGKATFIIHVKYRQNATWQGEIKWVNQNKTQYFRSSLEMLKLMDLALSEEFGKEVDIMWE